MNGPKKPLSDRFADIVSALLGGSDTQADSQYRAAAKAPGRAQGEGASRPTAKAPAFSFAPSCCVIRRPGATLGSGIVRPVRTKDGK